MRPSVYDVPLPSVAWDGIWLHGDPRYIAYPSGDWSDYGFRLLPLTGAVAGIEDAFTVWLNWFLAWGRSMPHHCLEDTLDQLFVPGSNGITDEDQKRALEVLRLALSSEEGPLQAALESIIAGTNPASTDDPQSRFRRCLGAFAGRQRRVWNLRHKPPRFPRTEYPLVGELIPDKRTQLMRLPDRDDWLVKMGFPPGYWLDPEQARRWPERLTLYPLEATDESVSQWHQASIATTGTFTPVDAALALNLILGAKPEIVPLPVWYKSTVRVIEAARRDPTLPAVNRAFDLARWGYTAFKMPVPPERPGSAGENLVLFLDRLEHWLGRPEGHIVDVPSAAVAAPPPGKRSKGIPHAEAEVRVRDWLLKNAKGYRDAVTRDQVARETGVSTGMVSKTKAWRAFEERRKEVRKGNPRTVPLTNKMLATIPANAESPSSSDEELYDEVRELTDTQREESVKNLTDAKKKCWRN